MVRIWLFMLSALFLLAPTDAEARKVALIIGNSDYANTSPLVNPANDIKPVAASARAAGFDDVTVAPALAANEWTGGASRRDRGCTDVQIQGVHVYVKKKLLYY